MRTKNKKKFPQADAILTADWHLRESQPECRLDNFWETQWNSMDWLKELQQEHDYPVIIEGVLSVMDNDDSDEGVALDSIQSHPGFAGLFDEFGKYMEHDPMWRDKSGTRWSKYLRSRTPVRPAFVMFRKDGAE